MIPHCSVNSGSTQNHLTMGHFNSGTLHICKIRKIHVITVLRLCGKYVWGKTAVY